MSAAFGYRFDEIATGGLEQGETAELPITLRKLSFQSLETQYNRRIFFLVLISLGVPIYLLKACVRALVCLCPYSDTFVRVLTLIPVKRAHAYVRSDIRVRLCICNFS